MPQLDEIVLPEDTPAWEWVRGRALQKAMPRMSHAVMQRLFAERLSQWAKTHPGKVGTEWDVRVQPPGEARRPLVPDVAYISNERLRPLDREAREIPPLSPDIVVEVLSPGDRQADVKHKREVYLASGTQLVITVDPKQRTVRTDDAGGTTQHFAEDDVVRTSAYPDLVIDLAPLFADLDGP